MEKCVTGPTQVAIAAPVTINLGQESGQMPPGFVGWVAVLAGSLLPDIDEPRSMANNPAGLFAKILPRWLQNFFNTSFRAISDSIRSAFGHRGATHDLLWPTLAIWLTSVFNMPYFWWLAWGYLWHQLADWVTTTGIPAFGLFERKTFSLLLKGLGLKTDGPVETMLNPACWLVILFGLYRYF